MRLCPRAAQSNHHTAANKAHMEIKPSDLVMGNKIGAGAFGTVYAGTWRGSKVAIKVVQSATQQDWQSFVAEAEVYRSLRPHTNVVLFQVAHGVALEGFAWHDIACIAMSLVFLLSL